MMNKQKMVKTYLHYTYSKDGQKSLRAVSSLRRVDARSTVVVLMDGNDPLGDGEVEELVRMGCFVRPTHFPRHGNLRGFECAKEMVRELVQAARSCDVVVKFDADVVWLDVDWLGDFYASGKLVGGLRSPCGKGIWGPCYAVRADFAPRLFAEYFRGLSPVYLTEEDYELCNRSVLASGLASHEVFYQLSYEDAGAPYSRLVQVHETTRAGVPLDGVPVGGTPSDVVN